MTETDIAVAGGAYSYPTPAAAWDLRRYLWYKLLRFPELADDDADVWAFYNNSQGSSERRYADALVQFERAFLVAPAVLENLDTLFDQQAVIVAEILTLDTLINQDTAALNETAAAALALKMIELAVCIQDIAAGQEDYTDERNANLQAIQAMADTLPAVEEYEQAWATILDAAIQKGQGQLPDSAARSALLAVANACPEMVGVAWNAVLPFLPIEDAAPYQGRESEEGCIEERTLSIKPYEDLSIRVIPNPASNHLVACLARPMEGIWRISACSGQVLVEIQNQAAQDRLDISLPDLPPGLYTVSFATFRGQYVTTKFSIVK